MKIAIISKKGGVTKSTQAKELSYRFNTPIVNLDIDSHLRENFKDLKIIDVNENELIPKLDSCIYDFPAGDIFTKWQNTKEIIKDCDLIIIPTLYGVESVDRAIVTYNSIFNINDKILFIFAQCKDIEFALDTKSYIEDTVNQEIVLHSIKWSKAMEDAEAEGVSVYDIAKRANKLIKRNYDKGIIKDYEDLFEIIEEVV